MSRIGGRKTVNLPSAARPRVWGCPPLQHPGRAGGGRKTIRLSRRRNRTLRGTGAALRSSRNLRRKPVPQRPNARLQRGVLRALEIRVGVQNRSRLAFGELDQLRVRQDRKSTRLNSSHVAISYAVFCL